MAGILVVTYNSEDVIEGCLRACLALPGDHTIVVVDNASTDGTVARVQAIGVSLEANTWNRGFAGAVNQGISALDTAAVLLLNPDCQPLTGISAMETAVLAGRTGAVGAKLQGGALQPRSLPSAWTLAFEVLGLNRLFPWNAINRRYRSPLPGARDVQPPGAFLMIRRDAWLSIGGFDEQFYPVWFEDVDFCRRLVDEGWEVTVSADATALHLGGHSVTRLGWSSRQKFWYGSLLRYAQKHFRTAPRLLVAECVVIACLPRTLAGLILSRSWEPWSVYIELIRQACRSIKVQSRTVCPAVETQTKT